MVPGFYHANSESMSLERTDHNARHEAATRLAHLSLDSNANKSLFLRDDLSASLNGFADYAALRIPRSV